MIEADRLVTASPREREEQQDRAIRPLKLAEYIGQPVVREQMELFIQAAASGIEALAITDVAPEEIAATQSALSSELGRLPPWDGATE